MSPEPARSTNPASTADPTMTMVSAINDTLRAEMARDERVMVFGEDVALSGGVFRATEGLLEQFGEDRVVDMPLAEAAILGAAAGLAAGGMVPVPEIQFLGFSYQAMHQLAGQIARFRYRTWGRFEMPITIRTPFGGGVRTPELHSDSLEGQLTNIAGLKVVTPATAADAKGLLTEAIRDPDPVVFLEPLRGYRGVKGPVPRGEYRVPFGKARWATAGNDVTIIAWSYQVEVALRAARSLAEQGVEAGVLDLRTLVPLDVEQIVEAVERTGRVVVVEEAVPTGGFAAEIIATINEHAFWSLEAPPVRVSGYDTPYPVGQLEDTYVPDARRIEHAVLALLEVQP
ncbi:MAG: alpha-ketoacid dehydrogenase subunit beta [Actinomycetota bacterium]